MSLADEQPIAPWPVRFLAAALSVRDPEARACTHLGEKLALATDRRHLRYEIVIEDPAGLTSAATFSTEWDYRPGLEPSGLACDVGVARRALEQ